MSVTIKEVEEKTGMSRTNIRFYENEGLINPRRKENGYREYSTMDAQILMKVKLLRSMDIPLDHVKMVASGKRPLCAVLEELDQSIEQKRIQQERARHALYKMQQDGTEFGDLRPEEYLSMLESSESVEDAPPRLNLPWRRYWARCFDFNLYHTVIRVLLFDFQNRFFLVLILTLLSMLIVEPMLLSLFGTTVGKAIFGIRITDREGGKLSYNTAIERTWTVMWEGEALRIPLICLYFQYKSLDLAEQEVPLSWENESELTYTDDKIWRYGLCFVTILAQAVAAIWIATILGG